jgi:tRNA(Ile)-lysidine synthase
MASEMGMGLEEAGREARYAFFAEAAFGMDCNLIATAHTLTDHVETILLNITRGTGLSGLAGIPETRDRIIRPLLPFTRDETSAYCRDYEFWTHDDPANVDLAFSRARIRSQVIPELKQINPALEQAVLRLSVVAEEEDRFLNGMAAAALEQAEIPLNGDLKFLTDDVEMRFDRLKIAHLPHPLKKRALRLATEVLGAPLSFDQTQVVTNGIGFETSGAITADGGEVVIEWNPTSIDVRKLMPAIPFRFGITIPGETLSEEFGWQFTAFETPPDGHAPKRAALETTIDLARIKGPLHFRTLKTGDMMQPLGFSGRRKLSDLLSEAKLSNAARARLPIVCDMIGPVWAPGVCLDERARPIEKTTRVIVLRFGTLRP